MLAVLNHFTVHCFTVVSVMNKSVIIYFSSALRIVDEWECVDPYLMSVFALFCSAHHPGTGSACSERDPAKSTCTLQELCRTDHYENTGGTQRLPQRGQTQEKPFLYCCLRWISLHIGKEYNEVKGMMMASMNFKLSVGDRRYTAFRWQVIFTPCKIPAWSNSYNQSSYMANQ